MTGNILKLAVITFIAAMVVSCKKDITDKFADADFKKAVYVVLGKNPGAPIYDSDVKNIKSLDVSDKSIASLAGIEYFTALDSLKCSKNPLTVLDVSKNAKLEVLRCDSNQLTVLDVTKNVKLRKLVCPYNKLTALDLSKNIALTMLECRNNQLAALDVSKNSKLTGLSCGDNLLTALDVSKNIAIDTLYCHTNRLTALDVSNNIELKLLICFSNQLSALDVSKNTKLTALDCGNNQLTALDVSKNIALTELGCNYNQLTELDVSKNTALTMLWCHYNFMANQSAVKGFGGKWDDDKFMFSPQRTPPLTDARDGKVYKTVKIGGKTWMGENLNYKTPKGSWCYDDNEANCNKYGRLYDWNTAKKSCPTGWHLPSSKEWDNLAQAVGGKKERYEDDEIAFNYWDGAGKKLKSTSAWNQRDNGSSGNGTDDYGFSALPGGGRYYADGSFNYAGDFGGWWTATEYNSDYAYNRGVNYDYDTLYDNKFSKADGFSVRCVGN